MINAFRSSQISVKKMASGHELSINLIEVTGKKPGPTTYIQSSVHGAEIQGNVVIKKIIEWTKKNEINGKIIFVPNANPYALIQKSGLYTQGRYNPVTGNNFNRNYINLFGSLNRRDELEAFLNATSDGENLREKFKTHIKSCIQRLIQEKNLYGIGEDLYLCLTLQNLAASADICLDLHTGPIACEYLYSNSDQKEDSTKYFPFEFIIDIPTEFAGAMDEAFFINYVEANKILKRLGRKTLDYASYTVELGCEDVISDDTATNYAQKILQYLRHKGQMNSDVEFSYPLLNGKKYFNLSNYKTYHASTGGHIEYLAKPGLFVRKGEILARIFQPSFDDNAFHELSVNALADCWIINHQNSGIVHQGMEIYQVGENVEIIQ